MKILLSDPSFSGSFGAMDGAEKSSDSQRKLDIKKIKNIEKKLIKIVKKLNMAFYTRISSLSYDILSSKIIRSSL